jgi:hypothetical protein
MLSAVWYEFAFEKSGWLLFHEENNWPLGGAVRIKSRSLTEAVCDVLAQQINWVGTLKKLTQTVNFFRTRISNNNFKLHRIWKLNLSNELKILKTSSRLHFNSHFKNQLQTQTFRLSSEWFFVLLKKRMVFCQNLFHFNRIK